MNEKNFSMRIRNKCARNNPLLWIQTFEGANRGVQGVPDLYCVNRKQRGFWIETKVVPSIDCCIPFRKGQPQWLDTHENAGGLAYITVLAQREEEIFHILARNVHSLLGKKLREISHLRFRTFRDDQEGWIMLRQALES